MSEQELSLSEQQEIRRRKIDELRALGIEPFAYEFDATHKTSHLKENEALIKTEENPSPETVSIAGRVMTRRIMGKASFFTLQDDIGVIQVYISLNDVGEQAYNEVFKSLVDIGDFVGIKGFLFRTRTGELTVHAQEFAFLTKTMRPIPTPKEVEENGVKKVFDAFSDKELRYRMRYVDLVVNPHVKEVFRQRTKLIQAMRQFMNDAGYLEVETPVLQPVYGGASARPFTTHHNALDMELFLRISDELYLKRLIVGGFEGVYEFSKDFRNEGMSRFHNPEFTLMELYVAYKDYNWMMDFTEAMIEHIALTLHGTTKVPVGEHIIDFKRPWTRITMFDAIEKETDFNLYGKSVDELKSIARQLRIQIDDTMGAGKLIDEIFGEYVEPKLIQPTFITDYPVEMSPLAKKHRSKEGLVERFEAICNGKEICNAFSELNDPIDQRQRLEGQSALREKGDEEAMAIDEDFIRALEYGMPPTAGLGIGVDRLAMIMCNQESIRDVLFFPHMRPE